MDGDEPPSPQWRIPENQLKKDSAIAILRYTPNYWQARLPSQQHALVHTHRSDAGISMYLESP